MEPRSCVAQLATFRFREMPNSTIIKRKEAKYNRARAALKLSDTVLWAAEMDYKIDIGTLTKT